MFKKKHYGEYERNERRKKIYTFLKKPFVQQLIVSTAALYLRLVYISSRKVIVNPERAKDFVEAKQYMLGCFWHGRLCYAPVTWHLGKNPVAMLISNHNDGQIISNVIGKLHIKTIAGSTGKEGIQALKKTVETLQKEHSVCFTPDGPKGPAFKVSEGVLAAARLSGVPIISVGLSSTLVKRVNSWDCFFIPFPFGKMAIVWGEPIYVPKDAKGDDLAIYRQKLEDELNRITRKADEICRQKSPIPTLKEEAI
ncbi:MAG: lysophospholipid acyltransferase family protein [Alphaproteobacteria bacterium]